MFLFSEFSVTECFLECGALALLDQQRGRDLHSIISYDTVKREMIHIDREVYYTVI
jgi:hypothetical protein